MRQKIMRGQLNGFPRQWARTLLPLYAIVFYATMKEFDLPSLVHVGEEKAVHGANTYSFANPLL